MISKLYRKRYLYLMLAPAFIAVLIFSYVPLLGWVMAFKSYQVGLSVWKSDWIGWENFKLFFAQSNDFVYLLQNTLSMNLMMIVVNLGTGIIFAILINEIRSKLFTKTVQTISFFPFFISWVIIYSVATSFLSQSSGVINLMLTDIGILSHGLNFLGDKNYSWFLVVAMEAWKSMGYNSVIFIATIASIPVDEYEAAEIDGANRFQKIRYVTWPHLIPTLVVLLILNSGWILNSNFDLYFMFTNPTNWEKMEVLDMYIFKFGLKQLDFSYATAVGMVKTCVSIVLILLVNVLAKKTTGKGIM